MIELRQQGHVSVLTLNRPERRNAIDAQACGAIAVAVDEATSAETRVLIVRGEGTNFCAGADLTGVEDHTFATRLRTALLALRDAPFPTIAAVHGAALGAGTQLAIACDLRVAADGSRFGIPAGKLGLMVDQWTVQRLSLMVGHATARAMLLSAEEVSAERAFGIGFVDRIGDLDAALAWAEHIAALAPLSVQGHKLALNSLEPEVVTDSKVEAAFLRAWHSDDVVEGKAAFAERRPPNFQGR